MCGFHLCLMLLLAGSDPFLSLSEKNLFPRTGEVRGWMQVGNVRVFQAENLYEYVDGDDERYLHAGVRRAWTTDFQYQKSIECVVDIYAMGSLEGAKELLASESSVNRSAISLGNDGYSFDGGLVFRKNCFVVRLTVTGDPTGSQTPLAELGHAVERRLAQAGC